jgi:hypothetical protein
MFRIKPVIFGAALSVGALAAGTVLAQGAGLVTVDISGISADVAAELGEDFDDLPGTIDLTAEAAADACGVDVADLGDSCTAINVTSELTDAVEASFEGDGNGEGADNSAREFAPGQQDGPARDFAPGQQDGPANESAPGQQKKDD